MDFEQFIKTEAKKIDSLVQLNLADWEKEIQKKTPSLKKYAKAFKEAGEGGKKIRGILVKLGYEIAGGQNSNDILEVASAYEIFHTSILAHDDVIDQSPIRRGKPSLYKVLGGGHHGISQAICLGDIGFFLATKIISQAKFPDKEKIKALQYFSKTIMDTALGEMLDVELPFLDNHRQEKDVKLIMKLKTAKYSIIGPLQLGAILAGSDHGLLGNLGKFGENLGIAFQIQDDILGVFGEEKQLGKSNKSDIEEGKNTVLIVEALKNGNPKQLKELKRYYGKGKISEDQLLQIREIFKQTGALKYAQKIALKYINQSKKIIPELTKDVTLSTLLVQMAEYLVERKK